MHGNPEDSQDFSAMMQRAVYDRDLVGAPSRDAADDPLTP
jgi:hypothetical protein